MDSLLETLRNLHFIVKVSDEGSGWLPAHEPAAIKLDEVLTALRGKAPLAEDFTAACGPVIELLCKEAGLRSETLQGITIHDLLDVKA